MISEWRDHAACRGLDPELFFDDSRVDDAIAVCAGCPVREACHLWAQQTHTPFGVWGGRLRTRRNTKRPKPVVSGDFDDEKLTAVASLTYNRKSAAQIAETLGMDERTVCRYRARLRELARIAC